MNPNEPQPIIKVMIAEDELLVRIGIKSSIDWKKHHFELIGEASDGLEALSMLRKNPPHILLLDIKLPNLSGLEILHTIRNEQINTKVIIISSWDDFTTVKQAMQLGAYEYVHKPRMLQGEVLELMLRIQRQIYEEGTGEKAINSNEKNSVSPQTLLCDLVSYPSAVPPCQQLQKLFGNTAYAVMLFSLTGFFRKKDSFPEYNIDIVHNASANLISEFMSVKTNAYFFSVRPNEYFILILLEDAPPAIQNEKIITFSNSLIGMLNRFINMTSTVGISLLHSDFSKISEAIQQAKRAHDYYFFTEKQISFFYEMSEPEEGQQLVLKKLLEQMLLTAQLHSYQNHLSLFDQYCQTVVQTYYLSSEKMIRQTQNMIYLMTDNELTLCELYLQNLSCCETIKELSVCYHNAVNDWMSIQSNPQNPVVQNILNYVHTHYTEDISLTTLSELFHMTEHYISRIFKRETKENLFSYLNKVRIDQAKKLLLNTDMKIYEIAEKTGFKSAINFNYVFNRVVGISPTKFKNHSISKVIQHTPLKEQ